VQRLEGQLQGLIQLSPNGQDRRSQERRSPSTEKELDLLRFKSVDLDNKVLELQLERDGLQESLRLEVMQFFKSLATEYVSGLTFEFCC
jgi:hypothetical protein